MAVCKKCSAKIPGNEKICPRCGASVKTGKKEVRGLKNRCPACGGKVSAKDEKCARCGKRLKKRGGSAPALYALIGVAFALIVMFIGISMMEKGDKSAPAANVETAQATPTVQATPVVQLQPQTEADADAQSQIWGEDSATGEEMQPWGEDVQPWGEDAQPWGEEAQPWGEDAQPWGEEAQPWGEDAAVSDEEFLAWGEEPEGLATWATPAPVTPGVVQSGEDAGADEYAAALFAAMEADASAGAVVITGPDGSTKQVSAAEAGNYVSSILSLRVTDLPEGSQVVFDVFDSEEMGWMVEVSITMPQAAVAQMARADDGEIYAAFEQNMIAPIADTARGVLSFDVNVGICVYPEPGDNADYAIRIFYPAGGGTGMFGEDPDSIGIFRGSALFS